MPQLGETVTEGTITRWFKQVGETIEADEPLFEVSTDKVDSEVPAPTAGVVSEILVPEGETVEVGARLAVISDGSAAPAAAPGARGNARTRAGTAPGSDTAARAAPPPTPHPSPKRPRRRHPRRRRRRHRRSHGKPPRRARAGPPLPVNPTVLVASPIVRRLITEHGLDPAQIRGTGEGGRITRNDVLAAAREGGAPQPRARAPQPPAPAACAGRPGTRGRAGTRSRAGAGDEVVPFDNIRRRTAEHMVRSKATSAHVYTSVRVDFERIERVRRAHQARVEGRGGLLAHVPAVHRARVLRRRARLPARERERRRRLARRAPRPPPRHRGRPRLQGLDRAGDPQRRRQAAAPHRP